MKKEEISKKLESDRGDTEFVLRTLDEEKTFLENYGKSVLEKELAPAVSGIHNQYDDDLEKIFGKRKKPGEKTYNFMKAEFSALKDKADRVDQLETEIESLKKGSPEVDAKIREIKNLQGEIEKIRHDYDNRITEMSKQNLRNNVKAEIERGLLGIKIKSGIPEAMTKIYVDNIVSELSENAEIREGKIIFLDKDKQALRDPKTMLPYTAEALLKDRMKDVIDTGRKQDGPGLPPDVNPVIKDKDGKFQINFVLPDSVKDKAQLGDYLIKELGLKRASPEYREAYAKFSVDLPLPK